MDKSWMQLQNRSLPEYINGVKEFLNFAVLHKENGETIKCLCCKCNNYVSLTVDQVSDHLIVNGILRSYDPWTYHGEMYSSDEHGYMNDSDYMEEDNDDMVGDRTWKMLQELNNQSLFNEWETTSTSTNVLGEKPIESNTFAKLFHDASQPLYPGCKSSKLTFIVKLLHLKILNGWSNKSFTMLLALLKDILPRGTEVPCTYYNAKEIVHNLGLQYVKIDACKNDCILLWDEFKDLNACPTCNTSRYRCVSANNTKVPHKILRYFPLKPRLQRPFVYTKTVLDMRWHDEKLINDGNLRHPADSSEWKEFDQKFTLFASKIRNVRFGLRSDGINPFDNISTSYSMWPVILVPYNLSPWRCMKDSFLMFSLLIPGLKAPKNDIDVYLQLFVKELIELWEIGVETYDASVKEIFQMHAALFSLC